VNYTDVIVTPRRQDGVVVENPWAELRRREHIVFALEPLPHSTGGAIYARWPDGEALVVIDPALGRRERRAALAHELIHDERGGGADSAGIPASWRAVVARDEHQVDDEVARRLVPLDQLRAFVDRCLDFAVGVDVVEVAEAFDVPESVAERALQLLTRGR
jgi:hypothetical protein